MKNAQSSKNVDCMITTFQSPAILRRRPEAAIPLLLSCELIGIILFPLGVLFMLVGTLKPQAAGAASEASTGWTMIIVGVILFTIGKIKDIRANKRVANPEQKLTFRRMLTTPDFIVYADSLQEAQES